MPARVKDFLRASPDVVVLHRDEARHHLDEGHLRPEGIVDVAELHPDGAGADDDHALRLFSGRIMASREPITLVPLKGSPGRSRDLAPVATMMFAVSSTWVLPSSARTSTAPPPKSLPGSRIEPKPFR